MFPPISKTPTQKNADLNNVNVNINVKLTSRKSRQVLQQKV